jgi:hypothetical protein
VSPPVFLQDNDDDHGHYHTRAVPLEAGGDPVPVKLYTSTCIKQARVFAAPNGLYYRWYAIEPPVLRWSRFRTARS